MVTCWQSAQQVHVGSNKGKLWWTSFSEDVEIATCTLSGGGKHKYTSFTLTHMHITLMLPLLVTGHCPTAHGHLPGEYNKPLCSLLSTTYKRYSHRLTQSCKSTGLNTQPLAEVISIPDLCTMQFCYHLTRCKGDRKARRRSSYHVSDIEGRGILMEPF